MTPILLALLLTSQDYHATLPAELLHLGPKDADTRVHETHFIGECCETRSINDWKGAYVLYSDKPLPDKFGGDGPLRSLFKSQWYWCHQAEILVGSMTYELHATDGVLTCKDGEVVKVERKP